MPCRQTQIGTDRSAANRVAHHAGLRTLPCGAAQAQILHRPRGLPGLSGARRKAPCDPRLQGIPRAHRPRQGDGGGIGAGTGAGIRDRRLAATPAARRVSAADFLWPVDLVIDVRGRRLEFTDATKRQAYERSGGICECHRVWQLPTSGTGCGRALSHGNQFYEHVDCDALGGLNDLDNCAVLVRTCWSLKTSSYDIPAITKDRHVADFARGIKARFGRPMVGTVASGIRKPMRGGDPIDRTTGLPWRLR
jgi:hypothetical protein